MTVLDDTPGADLIATELVHHRHNELLPSGDNLRGTLTDLSDLADSIAEAGLLQPLKITYEAGRPIIVAGHRRHAAIGQLIDDGRWPPGRRIACVTTPTDLDPESRTVAMLVENLQRVDLDPVEEANGYQRLKAAGWKHARIASTTGRPEKRVTARLALLKLPAPFQEAVSDGRLTLDLAAKIAAAPAAVADKLATRPGIPSLYQVETAVSDHERVTAIELVRANAKARGLHFDPNRPTWQFRQTHTSVSETTPKGLATVLLPADVTGWAVIYDQWSKIVFVWRPAVTPDTATTPTADDDTAGEELNEWERYAQACEEIDNADRAAQEAWRDRRHELEPVVAAQIDIKDVARAAMHYVLNWHNPAKLATRLGWEAPTGVDDDTIAASLAAWLDDGRHFTAAVALAMLTRRHRVDRWIIERLDEAAGPKPPDSEYPPKPRGYDAWNWGYTPNDPAWNDVIDLDDAGLQAYEEAADAEEHDAAEAHLDPDHQGDDEDGDDDD